MLDSKLMSEITQCDVCMEERKYLYTCGNSMTEKEIECQYKMCKYCLDDIRKTLDNRCPQCRNDIITEPDRNLLEKIKIQLNGCNFEDRCRVAKRNAGNVCFGISVFIFFYIFLIDSNR